MVGRKYYVVTGLDNNQGMANRETWAPSEFYILLHFLYVVMFSVEKSLIIYFQTNKFNLNYESCSKAIITCNVTILGARYKNIQK